MLKPEINEKLVRVGSGHPAGELFRRYWQPILLASELAENDGPPLRVRILGEDLVAFRDTKSRVGLMDAYCPHRRAPLFFGRNEECGLRCVYHGWKFDADGHCVDMPTEPADTPLKAGVRIKHYPTIEKGGVVWAYLGPPAAMPAPPDYEWTRVPAEHRHLSKTIEDCNYLQALEGGLDTAHSSFLHNNRLGDTKLLRNRDGAPHIEIQPANYGYSYVSMRDAGVDGRYVRVYHYIMPAQQMRANTMTRIGKPSKTPRLDGHIWVPIDDEHTCVFNWGYAYDASVRFTEEYKDAVDADYGRGKDDIIPGTFRLKRNLANDYMIDRQMQKAQSFTGIKGINTQDFALQEGMGPIVDRSKEYLGNSDMPIVTMRRMLLDAMTAVERGENPPATDPETYRRIRPHDRVVPDGQDWRQIFAPELLAKW